MDLSPVACRVLGALAEKRLTTPDQYPLSVRALQTACNQKSAREPVMDLAETDVQQGLRELRDEGLARTSPVRGRVSKHEHTLDVHLDLDDRDQTVLGVLLLRGPQTVGEIRTRTERWVDLPGLDEAQAVLERLRDHPFLPLVEELPREPGRREPRWRHLLGDTEPAAATTAPRAAPSRPAPAATPTATPPAVAAADDATAPDLADRVAALETEVASLRGELAALHDELATLRDRATPILEELG
jgi:uncharacterized protein YceH (UPF0502 family)